MLSTVAFGALAALTLVQGTDTIISAEGIRRLDLENAGGQVIIRTWDRDQIRIRAEHSRRTYLDIERRGAVLDVEAEADRGPATLVDYEITVPRDMDLDIEGLYTDVSIRGSDGAISVETLEGNIDIEGGRGSVKAGSVNGEVTIDGAQGRVEVETISRGMTITNVTGEVFAESVSGRITMRGIDASTVEAGSVSGTIIYEGTVQDGGQYTFGSHSGRIQMILPPGVNATVTAISLTGSFRSDYPGAPAQISRRRREPFALGSGSAQIEVETFSGSITLQQSGGEEEE